VNPSRMLTALGVALGLSSAGVMGVAFAKDLWVHPRNEPFNENVHYKAQDGEVFYKAENDLGRALGDITLERGDRPLVTLTIGQDIFRKVAQSKGTLRPVLLWDTDGDGRVDRSARGRIDGDTAIFDDPGLADVNLELVRWQLGVRYVAGDAGNGALDGRYLASVDSDDANIAFIRDDQLKREELAEAGPPVEAPAPPVKPGLVILKHRAGQPFDLAAFAEDPARFIEDFDRLSREADGDDWTANGENGDNGYLRTHFEAEDLFIIRTEGGASLEVEMGDMPLAAFFEFYLEVPADERGCYNSLNTQLRNDSGSDVEVPHRFLYCPKDSVALVDIPDGYQLGLTAVVGQQFIERTDASTTSWENFKLYAKEIYPRSPLSRSTGTVGGNIKAGFVDAGRDVKDIFRYAVTGVRPTSLHTGQETYYASPITAIPRALYSLVTLDPVGAITELGNGLDSVVNVGASAVSAVDNAVINPMVQGTVGFIASPNAADHTAHWMGAFTQTFTKNLPGGERSFDAYSVDGILHHNRGFEPVRYTRTDFQLNIDRVVTVVDASIIANASDDDGGDDDGGENGEENGGNGDNDNGGNGGNDNGGGNDTPMMNNGGGNNGGGNMEPPMMNNNGNGNPPPMMNNNGGNGNGNMKPPGNNHGKVKKKFPKKKRDKKVVKKRDKKKIDKKKFDKKKNFKKDKKSKFKKLKKDKKLKFKKAKKGNRSGLGDGTNPGKGAGRINSPNEGTLNPGGLRKIFGR
jgi:hypothetical protein